MILKLPNIGSGWIYCKGEIIEYEYLTAEEESSLIIGEFTRIEKDLNSNRPLKKFTVKVNQGVVIHERIIYSNMIAYLLNDDGKTIEKIN